MPTAFDQQTAHMRGRYTQYYDRNGVLRQGDPYEQLSRDHAQWQADARQRQSAAWRRKALRTAAGGAALFGGGALASMWTGAGAAGAGGASAAGLGPQAVGAAYPGAGLFGAPAAAAAPAAVAGPGSAAVAPAAASMGSRIGAMFNSPAMNLGVNAGLSLFGMRSQNKAAAQARLDMLQAQQQAIDLQLKQIEIAQRNADLDRAEARELADRAHKLEVQRFELDREARAFERQIYEQREARLAPFRQRGQQALDRLSAMWSLG